MNFHSILFAKTEDGIMNRELSKVKKEKNQLTRKHELILDNFIGLYRSSPYGEYKEFVSCSDTTY